jgi:CRISPR/Cas system-associated exonuclease Cas4 (RecB family)
MVRRSIHGFAQGPFLPAARQLAPEDWLSLEKLLDFEIDGAKVYVKMDLAHRRSGGGAVILDWKTGKRRPQPEGLQLGCYALYASQAWGIAPEQIQVIEANINTGAVGSAVLSVDHIEKARSEISVGIGEMRARLADPASNTARAEDFPASPSQPTCRRCVFREVCSDYQALTEARGQSAQPSAHWG